MTDYETKKRRFDDMITLYGRKPVLELLEDPTTDIHRLHLATSNKGSDIIHRIESLAGKRQIEIVRHSKEALSRISKNSRQDQGVAIDINSKRYGSIRDMPAFEAAEFIALDHITNSQNLGLIIRSVAASPIEGLILPEKGCAKIDPLVMKASAGTLIKATIYRCDTILTGIRLLKKRGFEVLGLAGDGKLQLNQLGSPTGNRVYLIGNESDGLSPEILALCDATVAIPINPEVESLNAAAAATLVAFSSIYR